MAARYQRWLIAKGNVFSPGGATLAKLVDRLRAERWVPDPATLAGLRFEGERASRAKATGGYAVWTIENTFADDRAAKVAAQTHALPKAVTADWLDDPEREELRLAWPVFADATTLRHPLTLRPDGPIGYTLEVCRAPDFVYPLRKQIGRIDTVCRCGEDLSFEWDDEELVPAFEGATGIFTECEECSRTFDPAKVTATLTNPFDGTRAEVNGGAAHRFALTIDCGDRVVEDARLAFEPALVALVEEVFGRSFYEVGATT